MELQGQRRLIPNRRIAVFVIALTAFLAVTTLRAAFRPYHSEWPLPPVLVLSKKILLAANVAVYAYLFWLSFVFFRATLGKERAIVAGWSLSIVLSFIQHFVSIPDAALIQHIKAISMAVAFGASVSILFEGAAPDDSSPDNREPR
jgi:hypothetical protein